jgi:hypothetical protein
MCITGWSVPDRIKLPRWGERLREPSDQFSTNPLTLTPALSLRERENGSTAIGFSRSLLNWEETDGALVQRTLSAGSGAGRRPTNVGRAERPLGPDTPCHQEKLSIMKICL